MILRIGLGRLNGLILLLAAVSCVNAEIQGNDSVEVGSTLTPTQPTVPSKQNTSQLGDVQKESTGIGEDVDHVQYHVEKGWLDQNDMVAKGNEGDNIATSTVVQAETSLYERAAMNSQLLDEVRLTRELLVREGEEEEENDFAKQLDQSKMNEINRLRLKELELESEKNQLDEQIRLSGIEHEREREREDLRLMEMEMEMERERQEREKERERERELEREKEIEREREMEKEKEREMEIEREIERERQKQKEIEREREKERENQWVMERERERQKEIERDREREKEIERERQKEIEREKEMEMEKEKERERNMETERERRLRLEMEKEKEKKRETVADPVPGSEEVAMAHDDPSSPIGQEGRGRLTASQRKHLEMNHKRHLESRLKRQAEILKKKLLAKKREEEGGEGEGEGEGERDIVSEQPLVDQVLSIEDISAMESQVLAEIEEEERLKALGETTTQDEKEADGPIVGQGNHGHPPLPKGGNDAMEGGQIDDPLQQTNEQEERERKEVLTPSDIIPLNTNNNNNNGNVQPGSTAVTSTMTMATTHVSTVTSLPTTSHLIMRQPLQNGAEDQPIDNDPDQKVGSGIGASTIKGNREITDEPIVQRKGEDVGAMGAHPGANIDMYQSDLELKTGLHGDKPTINTDTPTTANQNILLGYEMVTNYIKSLLSSSWGYTQLAFRILGKILKQIDSLTSLTRTAEWRLGLSQGSINNHLSKALSSPVVFVHLLLLASGACLCPMLIFLLCFSNRLFPRNRSTYKEDDNSKPFSNTNENRNAEVEARLVQQVERAHSDLSDANTRVQEMQSWAEGLQYELTQLHKEHDTLHHKAAYVDSLNLENVRLKQDIQALNDQLKQSSGK
eukprot:Ihof_evm2s237 gene=Ihof_evmTU2s237